MVPSPARRSFGCVCVWKVGRKKEKEGTRIGKDMEEYKINSTVGEMESDEGTEKERREGEKGERGRETSFGRQKRKRKVVWP